MNTVAVYGSLKKGKYNHPLMETSELLGKATIKAKMFSLGSYPAIIKGDDEHEVELYNMPDDMFSRVQGMELGAGYIEEEQEFTIDGESIKATVYYAGQHLEEYCKKNREVIKSY